MIDRVTRNAIVLILGTPDKTEGSLNSPVELEEQGIHYNEKWTYSHLKGDPSGMPMRLIYWHRYDFEGTLVRSSSDGEWLPDTTLLEASKDEPNRLATVPGDQKALPGTRLYHPASEVRDALDLGGYIEGTKE